MPLLFRTLNAVDSCTFHLVCTILITSVTNVYTLMLFLVPLPSLLLSITSHVGICPSKETEIRAYDDESKQIARDITWHDSIPAHPHPPKRLRAHLFERRAIDAEPHGARAASPNAAPEDAAPPTQTRMAATDARWPQRQRTTEASWPHRGALPSKTTCLRRAHGGWGRAGRGL